MPIAAGQMQARRLCFRSRLAPHMASNRQKLCPYAPALHSLLPRTTTSTAHPWMLAVTQNSTHLLFPRLHTSSTYHWVGVGGDASLLDKSRVLKRRRASGKASAMCQIRRKIGIPREDTNSDSAKPAVSPPPARKFVPPVPPTAPRADGLPVTMINPPSAETTSKGFQCLCANSLTEAKSMIFYANNLVTVAPTSRKGFSWVSEGGGG